MPQRVPGTELLVKITGHSQSGGWHLLRAPTVCQVLCWVLGTNRCVQSLKQPYEAGILIVPVSQRSKATLRDTVNCPHQPATSQYLVQ